MAARNKHDCRVIGNKYKLYSSCILGQGAYAVVFKGSHLETTQPVAIKRINFKNTPERLSKDKQKEISILKQLKHKNIVQYYDYYVEPKETCAFLIMEYCDGGDLADYLLAKKTLSEETIRWFLSQIAAAVQVMHKHNVIHRDLKPQNVLLLHNKEPLASINPLSITLKIADFGFARELGSEAMAHTVCGSPLYMAPEVLLSEPYDGKADLWSIGTIMYQCKYGKAPFTATNPAALAKKYRKDKLVPTIDEGTTSRVLADLLRRLLTKNTKDRIEFEEFFIHPFITEDKMPDGSFGVDIHYTVSSEPMPIRKHKTSSSNNQYSPLSSSGHYQYSISSAGSSPSSICPPSYHHVNTSSESSSLQYSEKTEDGFIIIDPKSSPRPTRRGYRRPSNAINIPFSQLSHSPSDTTTQHLSPSPSNNSPFKTLLRPSETACTIPEDSLYEPYSKSPPTYTPPGIRRTVNQPHSLSPFSIRRQVSQERLSRQYSVSPFVDYRRPDSYSSNSSSPLKRTSIEESFITDSMLLRSSRTVDHSRRYPEGSSTTTRLRSNTLPRVRSRECYHQQPNSLPNDDPLEALNKNFFLSGLIDRENIIQVQAIKPAFSNSGSRRNSTSGTEPIFSLMEISEEEPFANCMTALTEAITIVDEILRMAKQREGNAINFSRELFSLSMSGNVEQPQRYSERLVLYMKANNLLKATLKDVELEVASSSQEPQDGLKKEQEKAKELQTFCHSEAIKAARLVQSISERKNQQLSSVKAERLLYLRAMDLCQAVALDESFGSQKLSECAKRYKIAHCILKHLLQVVSSKRDKNILQNYILILENRINHVSGQDMSN